MSYAIGAIRWNTDHKSLVIKYSEHKQCPIQFESENSHRSVSTSFAMKSGYLKESKSFSFAKLDKVHKIPVPSLWLFVYTVVH